MPIISTHVHVYTSVSEAGSGFGLISQAFELKM